MTSSASRVCHVIHLLLLTAKIQRQLSRHQSQFIIIYKIDVLNIHFDKFLGPTIKTWGSRFLLTNRRSGLLLLPTRSIQSQTRRDRRVIHHIVERTALQSLPSKLLRFLFSERSKGEPRSGSTWFLVRTR